MAVSATVIERTVLGDEHTVIADLTFSGNYPDEGEPLVLRSLGLSNQIFFLKFDGPAVAADGETAIVLGFDYTNNKILAFEAGAANAALPEKTASEAYPTGAYVRVLVIGN